MNTYTFRLTEVVTHEITVPALSETDAEMMAQMGRNSETVLCRDISCYDITERTMDATVGKTEDLEKKGLGQIVDLIIEEHGVTEASLRLLLSKYAGTFSNDPDVFRGWVIGHFGE